MRAINFNAGPAGLPLPALERARDELSTSRARACRSWSTATAARSTRRCTTRRSRCSPSCSAVPDTHQVLFLQGGAHPAVRDGADELPARRAGAPTTSSPASGARRPSRRRSCSARRASPPPPSAPTSLHARPHARPSCSSIPKAAYVHITTQQHHLRHAVARRSRRPARCRWSRHELGLHLAAVRRLAASRSSTPARRRTSVPRACVVVDRRARTSSRQGRKDIPKIFRYSTHAENNSLYNTPPTFAIYLMPQRARVDEGDGRPAGDGAAEPREGASCSTARIDQLRGLLPGAGGEGAARCMNIVFRLPTEALEEKFVAEAKKAADGRPQGPPQRRRHPGLAPTTR